MLARVPRRNTRRGPPPSKEGFLIKKARDKKFLGAEWHKRYFQLENGQLYFSDSKGQKTKLSDTIPLQGVDIVKHPKDSLIIEIHTIPVLQLKGSSKEEITEWFEALNEHAKYR